MQKIFFIAEEFFRSFRKSLFRDMLLMCMFSAGSVMAVLMGSYYLELGQQYSETIRYAGDGTWYGITIYEDDEEFKDTFVSAEGCINMLEYYDALSHLEGNPIYSAKTGQTIAVREGDFKEMLHGRSYDGFLSENHRGAFTAYFGDAGNGGQAECLLSLKSAQLDFRAYGIFALKTEEGEGFTEENLTIGTAADPIPVVLGNDYKGIIPVGHTLEIAISGTDYVYPCKVAGILEKGMQVPDHGDATQDMLTVDSYILFPFGIHVLDKQVQAGGLGRYAYLDMLSLGDAAVRVGDGDGFIPLAEKFQKLGQEFGLPPVQLTGGSLGLDLFRRESEESIRLILILTLILIFFTFYGLLVTLYDKVQANKRTYGIYLMNGCSVATLVISYLLEIAVILVPAVCLCRSVFLIGAVWEDPGVEELITAADCFTGISFVTGAVFIAVAMGGLNVEQLARKRD